MDFEHDGVPDIKQIVQRTDSYVADIPWFW